MSPRRLTETDRSIQSVARAMQMMKFIAANGNAAALTAISAAAGLSNSTAHGLLATLKQGGFVEQNEETGKYSLGLAVFELGQAVHRSLDLRAVALPCLRQLGGKYGETVHLAYLAQGEVVYVEKVESPRSIRMISQVGLRNPAHCTGLGKALLAGLSEDELAVFLEKKALTRYTDNTITDAAALRAHLNMVRAAGYALDEEEIEAGLRCAAAPVRNHRGRTVAAVSISVPANRLPEELLPQIVADVKATALEISRRIGFRGEEGYR